MMGHAPGYARDARHAADSQTHIELIWIEGRLEHWLRFGLHVGEHIVSRRTRVLSFPPDALFALIRWAANDHGTVKSRIDIARTVRPGEAYTTLPFVRPGGEILLSIEGWPKVEKVLGAIDRVEAAGVDPTRAAPDHWRHVHSRVAAGMDPRAYTAARHRAFELRQGLDL